ncbi:MAG: hypothetical protein R3F37_04035 [Candidatus Competibacteraceae bacterium]
MFQVANQDSNSNSEIAKSKALEGMGFSPSSNDTFVDVIRFLNQNDVADGTFGNLTEVSGDQNVISYFLVKDSNTKTNEYANAGGTGQAITMSDDPETLIDTITGIFNSILSISTTFVSGSVSVNTYNRAEILNQGVSRLVSAQGRARLAGQYQEAQDRRRCDDRRSVSLRSGRYGHQHQRTRTGRGCGRAVKIRLY